VVELRRLEITPYIAQDDTSRPCAADDRKPFDFPVRPAGTRMFSRANQKDLRTSLLSSQ
jgi:hypothetical protein